MADGFNLNSGVSRGGQRVNPEGVQTTPSVALPVPNNVPFVQPVNDTTNVQPNAGVMELARTLGNINFGALARGFGERSNAKARLRDEQQQAQGYATTAALLGQLGSDYETAVKSGMLPVSMAPPFQLGASLAAADAELMNLRKEILKRRVENPSASVFTEDQAFMSQFYGRLKGVRQEAVVKNFLEPMRALAEDDTKAYLQSYNVEQTQKFMSDSLKVLEDGVALGDPLSGAFNNAANKLKLGLHKTPESMTSLIKALGPQLIKRSVDANGKVNMAEAGKLLMELGDTAIQADGDRKLATFYPDAYEDLFNYVTGHVTKLAQADKAQQDAEQDNAQTEYIRYLRQNFSQIDVGTAVEFGVSKGLDANTALNLYKGWDAAAGNKSQQELTEDKQRASYRSIVSSMTASQRDAEEKKLNELYRTGYFNGRESEYNMSMDILHSIHDDAAKAPIASADVSALKSSLYTNMGTLFPDESTMNAFFTGATTGYRLSSKQKDEVRKYTAEHLTNLAMSWAQKNPDTSGFNEYQMAVENVANDQGGPARVAKMMGLRFYQQNQAELSSLVQSALTSSQPDAALSTLKLNTAPAPVTKPKAPKPVNPTPKQQPTSTKNQPTAQPKPSVARDSKAVAKAMGNLYDKKSNIFQYYAVHVRKKNPVMSDSEVLQRIKLFKPDQVYKLQQLYRRDNP